jgi:hypothetical protein
MKTLWNYLNAISLNFSNKAIDFSVVSQFEIMVSN